MGQKLGRDGELGYMEKQVDQERTLLLLQRRG